MKKKKEVVSRSKKISKIASEHKIVMQPNIQEKKPHIIHRIGNHIGNHLNNVGGHINRHIHNLRHHVYAYHKIRKQKEENLPKWKQKWHDWNEKYFAWLEHLVETLIPYLVILLLIVIFCEFAKYINPFHFQFMDNISNLFEQRRPVVDFFDGFTVSFFVIDLYFNFFKKRTFLTFLKTSILDIIAIIPLGFIFRIAQLSDVQGIFHIVGGVEKEVVKAANAIKIERVVSVTGGSLPETVKFISKIPKIIRLHRISDFFKKKN